MQSVGGDDIVYNLYLTISLSTSYCELIVWCVGHGSLYDDDEKKNTISLYLSMYIADKATILNSERSDEWVLYCIIIPCSRIG